MLGQGSPSEILEVIRMRSPDPDHIFFGGRVRSLTAIVLIWSHVHSSRNVVIDVPNVRRLPHLAGAFRMSHKCTMFAAILVTLRMS